MSEACGSDHCVVCSDEAAAMEIVELTQDGVARCIDEGGNRHDVMTDLVAGVAPGDRVLVHAGVALQLAETPGALLR